MTEKTSIQPPALADAASKAAATLTKSAAKPVAPPLSIASSSPVDIAATSAAAAILSFTPPFNVVDLEHAAKQAGALQSSPPVLVAQDHSNAAEMTAAGSQFPMAAVTGPREGYGI